MAHSEDFRMIPERIISACGRMSANPRFRRRETMATKTDPIQPQAQTQQSGLLDRIAEEQQRAAARYQPVMQPEAVAERYKQLRWYIDNVMTEGIDYGTVPGVEK